MSYQALARKWRPRTFSEVVGQGHVIKALENALDKERIHHAYLFSGTRGVGKTTIARIFAKSLNCEQGISSVPCGECGSCEEIDQGRFIDLIEVDAASRTKVEDTRELLDNVQYSPTCGRYKVYLIDEVHMLSGHSFNALLKTLEEPPPHVKFLLATTDPQKLPITVLSRCLQFNLKRLSDDNIAKQLKKLVQAENLKFDDQALRSIARAADGSVRDGLSLLDQAIAFTDGNITDSAVHEMLGTVSSEYLSRLMQAIASTDATKIMQCTNELSQASADFEGLIEDIIEVLHQTAMVQSVPSIIDTVNFNPELVKLLAEQLEPEDIQLFYQIAIIGKRDMYLSTSPQAGLEMTLLRMISFRPASAKKIDLSEVSKDAPTAEVKKKETERVETDVSTGNLEKDLNIESLDWNLLVTELNLQGVTHSLAANCSVGSIYENTILLNLSNQHEGIATKSATKKLENSLIEYFGSKINLKIELTAENFDTPAKEKDRKIAKKQSQIEQSVEEDKVVKALKTKFGAEVIEGSVKPVD